MNTRTRLILGLTVAASIAAGVVLFDGASAQLISGGLRLQAEAAPQAQPNGLRGQTTTQLSDGRWLVLGGQTSSGGALGTAVLSDAQNSASSPLGSSLSVARFDHSATVLPDGSVLITGGRNDAGPVSVVERFDPATQTFTVVPIAAGATRSGHTATLLPDGRVLVAGGTDGGGQTLPTEIWDLAAQKAESFALAVDRAGHTATLLPSGQVLLSGGRTSDGTSGDALSIDATAMTAAAVPLPVADSAAPFVVGSAPGNGARDVPLDTRMVVHFSDALRLDSLATATIRLTGKHGELRTNVVGAERGRLVFVWPLDALEEAEEYTLTIAGATNDAGLVITPATIGFTTARRPAAADLPDTEAWRPDAGNSWRSGRAPSPWETLPSLHAPPGTTAISGRVLRLDGRPLPNVTLEIEGHETETDKTGRFLLLADGLQTGEHTLDIDARSANQGNRVYGFYEARIRVRAGETNVLPFTIWSPVLDTAHQVTIPSPTTSETVITTPLIPGLELHLPAGTVIRDEDHKVVRTLSITPIPLDRTPFPLPDEATFTMYFTIQPGGAYLYTPGRSGGWLVYPRIGQSPVGKRVRFFNYAPEDKGWYAYGMGTVRETSVVPDARTRVYAFTGASFNDGNEPPPAGPPPGDCCGNDGDPVNLTTGIFTYEMTDLVVQDVMPLALTRTYNSQDTDPSSPRAFGIGMTHPYAIFLHSENAFEEADMILPDGGRVHYVRSPESGPSWWQTIFEHTTTPTAFYKSRITFWGGIIANGGWELKTKDGVAYVFGHGAPLQAIRDRNGNEIRLTWSDTNTFGSGAGNLVRITSPHGRWIEFSYYAGTNRVQQAKDNIGRTVSYTYDASGRLWKVTDPMNHVTEYTYDANHQMTKIKDRNGVEYVTNEYTTAADAPTPIGWVKRQTFAGGGTAQFAYSVNNGRSTQSDVTDERGFVRRATFNSNGYTLSDRRALGTAAEITTTSTRHVNSNFVESATDNQGHSTVSARNASGNETSTTWLSGTSNAVTATYDYHPTLNAVNLVTDALGHSTAVEYDAAGNVTGVLDGLNHRTSLSYSATGEITSVTNALQHTTTITYDRGDVRTVTDPLQRTRTFFTDAVGRIIRVDDPGGASNRFEYDAVDRRTKIIDPNGDETQFIYLPEGQLAQLIDAKSNVHTFTYNDRGQLLTQTDPLGRVSRNEYDTAGNLTSTMDRKGQVTTYQYDQLDRVSNITFDDASTMAFVYGADGQPEQIVDSSSGTITLDYDDLGRLTSETSALGAITYGYDVGNRLTSMTASGQPEIIYGYDAADRLTSITRGALTSTMSYDAANRRTSLTLPNGIVNSYDYDDSSQLTTISSTLGAATLATINYDYDLSGNRASVEGLPLALPQPMSAATYDAANQLTAWAQQQLSYDGNGNTASTGLITYTWNRRDQLVGISGSPSSSYAYDAGGRRVGRTIGSDIRSFLYDGANVVGEYVNGSLETAVWSNLGADEYLARIDGSTMQVPLTDGLGSVRNLTDALGAVTARLSYEPYGRTPNAAPLQYPYTFTSREADVDGLMYYRARYYDPALGRFISQDPLGLSAGVNAYAYAVSNPMSFTDPSGTSAKGAATILEALMGWIAGTLPTTVFGPAHPVTQDIRRTPAMDSIRKKYRQANCASKRYCGDYNEPEFFKTNNIVGHTIGAFCADLTNLGNGKVKVRAQNTWGLESGTRIPETFFGNNRNNSSVQEMLTGKGPWQYPKSLVEDKKTPGMFQNVTLWFLWTENLPCRCQ